MIESEDDYKNKRYEIRNKYHKNGDNLRDDHVIYHDNIC